MALGRVVPRALTFYTRPLFLPFSTPPPILALRRGGNKSNRARFRMSFCYQNYMLCLVVLEKSIFAIYHRGFTGKVFGI